MSGSKGGEPGHQGLSDESTILIIFVALAAVCAGVWYELRNLIVYMVYGMDWLFYSLLRAVGLLDATGRHFLDYITACLDGRIDPFSVTWDELNATQDDIGSRTRWWLTGVICLLSVVAAFKMRGDGYKRKFTLTGKSYKTVVRILGVTVNSKILKWIGSKILTRLRLAKETKEWVRNASSLVDYQAEYWRVVLTGAHFDPNVPDANRAPQKTPAEWLRDNKVSLAQRNGLDEDRAAEVFESQLGPTWQGVENAPTYVQALAVLFALNVKRDAKLQMFRDSLTEIYVLSPDAKTAEAHVKELMAPFLANEKIVRAINKKAVRHAYQNTAMLRLYGWGGPFKEWGTGGASELASCKFGWLKGMDRTLWYCMNNVGRRKFAVECAGAVGHFFAERVSGSSLMEPYVENSVRGLVDYLNEMSIDDLDDHFHVEDDFG